MAIARDAKSGTHAASGTATSWNHTCTGSNLLLLVGIECYSGDVVSSVTYNSVSMTQIGKASAGGGGQYIYIYGLANPTTGTNSVTINRSVSVGFNANAVSYTGCAQSGIPDASNTTVGYTNGSTYTRTLTTVANNCWIFICMGGNRNGIAGTGLTDESTDTNGCNVMDTNGALTPAGSHSVQYSTVSGGTNGDVYMSFAPAVASSSNSGFLNFF